MALVNWSRKAHYPLDLRAELNFYAKILVAITLLAAIQLPLGNKAFAEPENPKLRNERCLKCHGKESYSRKAANGEERQLHVSAEKFKQSVHGDRDCVSCHKDIVKIPHKKGIDRKVGCISCHQDLWEEAQLAGGNGEHARLGVVVKQIDSYLDSMHARPNIEDQSRTNATCYNCHDAHYITPIDSIANPEKRLEIPFVCGQCHAEVLDTYMTSVHGKEISSGNTDAAVCSDCHSTHGVSDPHDATGRVGITENCGNCHQENLETYTETYHGKVTRLGYGETAKCYDCHGSHGITRVNDEASKVYNSNRLETCQSCHADATEGYVTFQPHGTTDNLKKYPQMHQSS